jgi:hypothetical protein
MNQIENEIEIEIEIEIKSNGMKRVIEPAKQELFVILVLNMIFINLYIWIDRPI